MSHLVSPIDFRSGKTLPWSHSFLYFDKNHSQILNQDTGHSSGVENALNYILLRSNYCLVRSAAMVCRSSGVIKIKVLYYPLAKPLNRKRHFPTYFLARKLNRFFTGGSLGQLSKLWALRQLEFEERFVRSTRKVQLNKWLTRRISRGSGRYTNKIFKHRSYRSTNKINKWLKSPYKINQKAISNALSSRVGYRVQIKLINVYKYLSIRHRLNKKDHQDYIWGEYHYNKKIQAYYDIVSAFYLLAQLKNSERLLICILQHSLLKIHRRKIKPKRLFYFLDKVIKTIPDLKHKFSAFRVVITGKLRGGTARTGSFSVGFGSLPRQSLTNNVKIEFGDIRSKYGSFGVKVLTWRK